jgi:hypothetical protein
MERFQKVKIRLIAILFLSSTLSACVSPSATLSNSTGQTMKCSAFGFGLITGEMAKSRFNNCVENAQSKGYKLDAVRG